MSHSVGSIQSTRRAMRVNISLSPSQMACSFGRLAGRKVSILAANHYSETSSSMA